MQKIYVIFANLCYWQENYNFSSAAFRANLEHIFNFAGFSMLSIYFKIELN